MLHLSIKFNIIILHYCLLYKNILLSYLSIYRIKIKFSRIFHIIKYISLHLSIKFNIILLYCFLFENITYYYFLSINSIFLCKCILSAYIVKRRQILMISFSRSASSFLSFHKPLNKQNHLREHGGR